MSTAAHSIDHAYLDELAHEYRRACSASVGAKAAYQNGLYRYWRSRLRDKLNAVVSPYSFERAFPQAIPVSIAFSDGTQELLLRDFRLQDVTPVLDCSDRLASGKWSKREFTYDCTEAVVNNMTRLPRTK
jgi:hypothetical protein